MKIGVLTHSPNAYTQRRFTEVATQRGHKIRIIHMSYCYMNVSSTAPTVYYRSNETFQDLDAIIPSIQATHTFYGTAVLRQFELMGVYTLNSALAITWSRDKLRAFQLLARKHLPLPITGFADSPEETEKLIDIVGGAPLIIRLLEGTEGRGTIFAETHQAAVSVINAFKQLKTNILVQECIKEANGTDIRCVVVGQKVITAMQRSIIESDTAASPSPQLKSTTPMQITAAEKKIIIKATKAMKLNLATVDLIRSDRGPLIIEVDCSPHIEMLEKISHCDIITPIIQHVEENAKKDS
jgi:ribosomal protein S6--L-glutamate ligase